MNKILNTIEEALIADGFYFERKDLDRPWGGFWVIREDQTEKFVNKYFPEFSILEITKGLKVSPKILYVAPNSRLSWQYHHRRSEIWKVVQGTVGIVRSASDEEMPITEYRIGSTVILQKGERHRLVGLESWGLVAEIWQHIDPSNPSDEDDIVRLQDDFNRKTPDNNN